MKKLAILALGAVALTSSSYATVLLPGGVAIPLTPAVPPASTLLAGGFTPFVGSNFAGPQFSGLLFSSVQQETATGFLDFYYEVVLNPNSVSAVTAFTDSSFAGFTTDVSYSTVGGTAPYLASRTADGKTLAFDFLPVPGYGFLEPGNYSELVVVRTNAKAYTVGSTSIIGDGIANVATFAPAVVPEPASFAALSIGAVALLRRRRK